MDINITMSCDMYDPSSVNDKVYMCIIGEKMKICNIKC